MLISTRARLAILAMPKTGTTAIEAALAPLCEIRVTGDPRLKHMPYRRYARFLRPMLETGGHGGIESFCLIREPVDWLASWHRYRARPGIPDPRNSTLEIGFEAFVEAWLAPDPPPFAQVGRPARFVSDAQGRPAIDHLFRYEAPGAWTAFLSGRFGQALDIPRRNVSPDLPARLSPALRARLEAEMAGDLRIWQAARH